MCRNGTGRSVKATTTEVFVLSEEEQVLISQPFVKRPRAPHVCPKCGSHRTRSIGTPPDHRCDACEYVFRPLREGMEQPTRVQPKTPACPKCGSQRIRIVGQSGNPPLVHYRCEDCGYVFSRPLREDTDESTRIERPRCPKCGGHRMRSEGGSIVGEPPLVYYRCEGCGHLFARVYGQE